MVINRNKLLKIILQEYKSLLTEEDEDAKVLQFRKPSYEEQQKKEKEKKKQIILDFCKLVGQEWSEKYREYVKDVSKVNKEPFSRRDPEGNILSSIGQPTKQEKDEFEAQKVSRKKELNKIFLKNIREQFDKEIKNFLNANPKLGERLRVSLTEPKINDANYMAQFDKLKKEGEQKFFEGWNPKNPNQDLKQIIYSLYIFFVELCNYKTLAGTSAQPQEPVYKKIPYPGSQKTDGETPPQPPEKPERPNLRIVKEDNRRKNMLVTESKLRQIVKEEYEKLMKEAYGGRDTIDAPLEKDPQKRQQLRAEMESGKRVAEEFAETKKITPEMEDIIRNSVHAQTSAFQKLRTLLQFGTPDYEYYKKFSNHFMSK